MKRQRSHCARSGPVRGPRVLAGVELLEDRSAPTDLGLTAFTLLPDTPLPPFVQDPALSAETPSVVRCGRHSANTDSAPTLRFEGPVLPGADTAVAASQPGAPAAAPVAETPASHGEDLFQVVLDGSALVAGPFVAHTGSRARPWYDWTPADQLAPGTGATEGNAVPPAAAASGTLGTAVAPAAQEAFTDPRRAPDFADLLRPAAPAGNPLGLLPGQEKGRQEKTAM